MQIDPFPVRLEQELKYALAYAALVSAAANGRLPGHLSARECWLCPEMRRFAPRSLVVLVNSF